MLQQAIAPTDEEPRTTKLPNCYRCDCQPCGCSDGITLYHADCRDVLPLLPKVDLCLADPPYGMSNSGDTTHFTAGKGKRGIGRVRGKIVGDDQPFDPASFLDFPRVILWGSNHYAQRLPVGTTLVWIKKVDSALGGFLSDAEVAWMKGGHGVYVMRKDWAGFSRIATDGKTVHQNQKPLALMLWCIHKAKGDGLILDPYVGSGTTLRAAKDLGRKAIGIEIEEKYCKIAANRLRQEVLF